MSFLDTTAASARFSAPRLPALTAAQVAGAALVFLLVLYAQWSAAIWALAHNFMGIGLLSANADVLLGAALHNRLMITFPPLTAVAARILVAFPALADTLPVTIILNGAAVALTAAGWQTRLLRRGWHWAPALASVLLLTLNPFVMWMVVAGGGLGVAFALYALVVWGVFEYRDSDSIQALIVLSLSLGLLAISDVIGIYVAMAAVPLMFLIAPPRYIMRSATGYMVLIGFPAVGLVLSICYANWIFAGDGFAFAKDMGAAFLGAASRMDKTPWLLGFGGTLAGPALILVLAAVAAVPMLLPALFMPARRRIFPVIVTALAPVLGGVFATYMSVLPHPVWALGLLVPVAAEWLFRVEAGPDRPLGLPLLALGALMQVGVLTMRADHDMTAWLAAMAGQRQATLAEDDLTVGWYLRDKQDIAIDGRWSPGLIVGRGSAEGLLMPGQERMNISMLVKRMDAKWIAVPAPWTEAGARDVINQNMPDVWEMGLFGYERAYDFRNWRVYRRTTLSLEN